MHFIKKILFDIFLFSLSYLLAFLIRYELEIPPDILERIKISLPIVILIRIITFFFLKIYRYDYTYFSVPDALSILKAVSLSAILTGILFITFPVFFHCPRSVLIIDAYLVFVSACGTRFLINRFRQKDLKKGSKQGQRALIVGAGNIAESVLREIKSYGRYDYLPLGLVDDYPLKQGKIIQGVKVLGDLKSIPQIVDKKKVEALIIAIPLANTKQMTTILQHCKGLKVKILTIPSLREINEEKLLITQLKEVKPEEFLFREQVELDVKNLVDEISGKIIMVTGAGGSIGSELCRQISKYKPKELILFERSEYNLFCINNELIKNFPNLSIRAVIADMANYDLTWKIVNKYKPDIIFHAAAYKHVYLVEVNPEISIKNNVIGTMNVVQAAMNSHVEKFVLISSDKAVSPTNIMGATKRLCEEYIRSVVRANGHNFFAVRFGNVLGSSGSVLQIFKEQVAHGGPVTVTHVDAYRYFMTIPEAVHLVLQTITFAKGGEIFILDMGKPVRIYDLAKEFISKSGFKPEEDVDIIFTGLKQGEKLTEDLFEKTEKLESTPHEKILRIKNNNSIDLVQFKEDIDELVGYASEMNQKALIEKIEQMIPTFQSSFS